MSPTLNYFVHESSYVDEGVQIGADTRIWHFCHLLTGSVLGQRCRIGQNVVIGPRVQIGNNVVISGGAGVHHFVTIGDFAFIAGMARVNHDCPPFVKLDAADTVRGCNRVGLIRGGFSEQDADAIDEAIRKLFIRERGRPLTAVLDEFDAEAPNGQNSHVRALVEFIRRRNVNRNGRYLESLRTR